MTGTSTRPPTTLGRAPSIPATTIMTRAAVEAVPCVKQAVDAGHADVVEPFDRHCPSPRRVTAASSATGRSDGAGAATRIVPVPGGRVRCCERVDRGRAWSGYCIVAAPFQVVDASMAISGVARVTRRACPRSTMRRAIAAICSAFCPGRRRLPGSPGARAGGDRRGQSPDPRRGAAQGLDQTAARRRRGSPRATAARSARRGVGHETCKVERGRVTHTASGCNVSSDRLRFDAPQPTRLGCLIQARPAGCDPQTMTFTEALILAAYFFVLSILAVYGWHRYYLVYLYMKHRDNVPGPPPAPDPLPVVTIQLPIYNEMYVADRLIDAVCAHRLPAGPARDPGARRLDRRDARNRRAGRPPPRRAGLRHQVPPPHRPHRLQGRRARSRA